MASHTPLWCNKDDDNDSQISLWQVRHLHAVKDFHIKEWNTFGHVVNFWI